MDPEKAILRLLKQTQQGEVEWHIVGPYPYMVEATNDKVDTIYAAEVNGQKLAIYEERYRAYTDEDSFYWTARRRLDVIAEDGKLLWQFPASIYMNDLFDAAAYKAANVPKILEDLMK